MEEKMGDSLDGVDVRLVTGEGLHGLARSNVPHFRRGVAGSRDEDVLVGAEREAVEWWEGRKVQRTVIVEKKKEREKGLTS